MDKITSFTGQYRFLSNFFACDIVVEGKNFPSVEHAYQAAKFRGIDEGMVEDIRQAVTAKEAKLLGKFPEIRPDWESVKLGVMKELLTLKFSDEIFRELLMSTGTAELVEGNWWKDTFWGVCDGVGENHLGRLIMEVREELRDGLGHSG